jgi:hypothetical protein
MNPTIFRIPTSVVEQVPHFKPNLFIANHDFHPPKMLNLIGHLSCSGFPHGLILLAYCQKKSGRQSNFAQLTPRNGH